MLLAKSKECIANYQNAIKCVEETEEMMKLTFYTWPKRSPSADRLRSAGFYYTGIEDDVMCVECKAVLCEWEETDDPWIEHAKASPYCLLVRIYKELFSIPT